MAKTASKKSAKKTVSRTAAEFVAGAMKRKLDAKMMERTKLHALDTFAAMISGADMEPGIQALKYAKQFASSNGASGVIASVELPHAAGSTNRNFRMAVV